MDDDSLDALARAFQNGDMGSFGRLVRALTRQLIAVAYRYTRDWETARDLCQETWVKVHEKIDRYDTARSFRNWLLTIHRNGCISFLRKANVQPELVASAATQVTVSAPSANPDPYENIELKEFGARLRSAMTSLTESQQLVFTLVDIEQCEQETAASMLGMNFSTLRTTLHLARKRLAALLRKMEDSS